jgi:hypothetical protein
MVEGAFGKLSGVSAWKDSVVKNLIPLPQKHLYNHDLVFFCDFFFSFFVFFVFASFDYLT